MVNNRPGRIEYPDGIVFDPDALDPSLTEEAANIMNQFKDQVFIVTDQMTSVKEYENFLWTLLHTMEYGFEHKEFRECPVMYKFTNSKKEKVKWLQFRHFITNCIMWIPMVTVREYVPDAELTEDMIITADMMNGFDANAAGEYLDRFYTIPYAPYIDAHDYNRSISNTEYFMSQEAVLFLPFLGLSISLDLFMDLAKRMPRYKELLYFKLDPTKQPSELERDAQIAENEHRDLIIHDKEFNSLKALIHAIKGGQLREVHTVIGCKADDTGNTLPNPINCNYITGDLADIEKYYINSIGGRKAAIYNKEYMGTTGHLLILVTQMASTVKFSKTVKDCHSANPIPFTIKNAKYLEKMRGRYYKFPTEKEYHTIEPSRDTHLIGQTILVRSPATCGAPDGVCPVCYGQLYHNNKYLNSPGAYSAIYVMNPVTQAIMAVKHFQTTNSKPIRFQDDFYRFFEISGGEIILGKDIDLLEDYCLVIRKEDLKSNDPDEDIDLLWQDRSKFKKTKRSKKDDDDNSETAAPDDSGDVLNLDYSTVRFDVVKALDPKNAKKRPASDNEHYTFFDETNKDLMIHRDFINRLRTGTDDNGDYFYIPMEDISAEEFIFVVDVENEESSRASKQIQRLIDNKSHEGCDSIEALAQKFLDLLIEAKQDAASVHAEMILYKLIRDKDNILKRPNFQHIIMKDDYQLLSLTTALKNDPSINVSISTPFLKQQLVALDTTFEKTGLSDFDYMFKSNLEGLVNI